MLRLFHRYQKHVLGVALICAIALAMSGFGVNLFTKPPSIYAIKVDDQEISPAQLESERRQIENRYRAIFGKSYDSMRSALSRNIGQQAIDSLIQKALTDRTLSALGFTAGTKEYDQYLRVNVFQNNYSGELYKAILEQNRLTDLQFRKLVEDEVARMQFVEFINDASRPSEHEIRALYERRESKYSISSLTFDPGKFTTAVAEPAPEKVEAYYSEHEADFALPERLAYSYVTFDPEKFRSSVVVHPEDVEMIYNDNLSKYSRPEQVKVHHIQLNFPTENDPKKMADVRSKASEAHGKAKAGEPFESLVLQYSDDITTKALGGDLGWLSRGVKAPQFDAVAFNLKKGGIGDLVETDYGFHILKVEEYKAAQPKPLDEVKGEIEAEFRRDEAPAYAADKANELYEAWSKSSESLNDLASKNGLTVATTSNPLSREEDPSPALRGLTAKVFEQGNQSKILIELADQLVLVALGERKEAELRPLDQVKGEIIAKLKERGAKEAARHKAEETLAKLKDKSYSDLTAAAKALSLTVAQEKDLQPEKNTSGALASEEIRDLLLQHSAPMPVPDRVITNNDKFQLVSIDSVVKPDMSKADSELEALRRTQRNQNSELIIAALIEREKARSEIEVREGFIGEE